LLLSRRDEIIFVHSREIVQELENVVISSAIAFNGGVLSFFFEKHYLIRKCVRDSVKIGTVLYSAEIKLPECVYDSCHI
jgi:hypothetical protein